jgi:sortase B
MTRIKKLKRATAWLILIASVCVIAVFGYKLQETERIYQIGADGYENLTARIRHANPVEKIYENTESHSISVIPLLEIDFEELYTINADAGTWLYCPDTVIDYPVMRADDYDYYLHYLPDGTRNANGALFIDYNNAPDFTDDLTVIYGHSMKSGQMFGSLKGYKEQSYYEKHPFMFLYTELGNYRIELLYGCVIAAGEWRDQAYMYDLNLSSLLRYASANTTFVSDIEYAEGERVVAMSTCSYEYDDARYVVIGVVKQPQCATN